MIYRLQIRFVLANESGGVATRICRNSEAGFRAANSDSSSGYTIENGLESLVESLVVLYCDIELLCMRIKNYRVATNKKVRPDQGVVS